MSTTIGRRALRAPTLPDNPDIVRDITNLATDLQNVAVYNRGTPLPATGQIVGDLFRLTSDLTDGPNGTLYEWSGTSWIRSSPPVDGAAGQASSRTLGPGATQAAPGNDVRFSDARVPLPHADSHQPGAADDVGAMPIGGIIPYACSALPAGGKWDWADGGLIDRTTFAAFFAGAGHAYNGGVDPGSNKVRKPDKRGRCSIGADDMGTGAAGRLPNTPNRARGQNGGEERHLNTSGESGVPVHGHTASQSAHTHGFNGATLLSTSGGYANYNQGPSAAGTQTQTDNQTPAVTVNPASASSAAAAHNNMQLFEVDNYIVRIA